MGSGEVSYFSFVKDKKLKSKFTITIDKSLSEVTRTPQARQTKGWVKILITISNAPCTSVASVLIAQSLDKVPIVLFEISQNDRDQNDNGISIGLKEGQSTFCYTIPQYLAKILIEIS